MSEDEDGVVLKMQDTLEDRLIIFIQKFTKYFVDALKSQHLIAMREAKPNKNSSAGEGGKIQLVGKVIGGAVGAGTGLLTGVFGALSGAKVGVQVGAKAAELAGQRAVRDKAEKITKVTAALGDSDDESLATFKQQLVMLAIKIFSAYEYQLKRLIANGGHGQAMAQAAKDAVDRIMSFLVKVAESDAPIARETLLKGLVEGKSKGLFHKGDVVRVKDDDGAKWFFGEVFDLPGILVFRGSKCEAYKPVKKKCDVNKYKFRLAFEYEVLLLDDFDYAVIVTESNTSQDDFEMNTWTDDQMSQFSKKALESTKEMEEKVSDLYRLAMETSDALLQGQEEMKELLSEVHERLHAAKDDAEVRDLQMRNLVLQQGRNFQHLLHNNHLDKENGENGTGSTSLAKWWPRKPDLAPDLVERSLDGRSMAESVHESLQKKRRLVLTGMGGTGKTTAAKKYANFYGEDFAHVIWIDSEGEYALSRSILSLADALFIPILLNDGVTRKDLTTLAGEIAAQLRKYPCLFLFDNTDATFQMDKILSPEPEHFSLLTSRFREWPPDLAVLEVGLFSPEEAVACLNANIVKDAPKTNLNNVEGVNAHIAHLAERLQYLPLALGQAAACMARLGLSPTEYLEEFEKESTAVLGFMVAGQESTIFTTWRVSVDAIVRSSEHVGQLALKILQCWFKPHAKTSIRLVGLNQHHLTDMSFLHPDEIPRELFQGLARTKFDLSQAIDLLRSYSLIRSAKSGLHIHRLVQETMRISLKKDDPDDLTLGSTFRLMLNFLKNNFIDNPAMIHLNMVAQHASQKPKKHKLQLLQHREMEVMTLLNAGKLSESKALMQEVLESYSEVSHSSTSRRVLMDKCLHGHIVAESYLLSEGRREIRDVLAMVSARHGEVFSDTIDLTFLLGRLELFNYRSTMREVTCLKTLELVLNRQLVNPKFGKEHPKTILTKMSLALAHLKLKQEVQAKELLAEVDMDRRQLLLSLVVNSGASSGDPEQLPNQMLYQRLRTVLNDLSHFYLDKRTLGRTNAAVLFVTSKNRLRQILATIFGHPESIFGIEFLWMAMKIERGILEACDHKGFSELTQLLDAHRQPLDEVKSLEASNFLGFCLAMQNEFEEALKVFHDIFTRIGSISASPEYIIAKIGIAFVFELSKTKEKSVFALKGALDEIKESFGEYDPNAKLIEDHLKRVDQGTNVGEEGNFQDKSALFDDPLEALRYAIEADNLDFFDFLLDDFDVTTNGETGDNLVHYVAAAGNFPMMQSLVKKLSGLTESVQQKVVHHPNHMGHLPLIETLESKDYDWRVAEVLLNGVQDINVRDLLGWTPLHSAVLFQREQVVKTLLTRPELDLRAMTKNGNSVLHICAKNKNADIINLVLENAKERMTDEEEFKSKTGNTPIAQAFLRNARSIVEALIMCGADVIAANNEGWTPLHLAARKGYEDLTLLALSHGADINVKNNDGRSPLHVASSGTSPTYVRLLLSNGADPVMADSPYATSTLLQLAMFNEDEDVFGLLVDAIADKYPGKKSKAQLAKVLDQKDHEGDTPLMAAVIKHKNHFIKALLKRGSNLRETNDKGRNALHWAGESGNESAVELLMDEGLSLLEEDIEGNLPAHVAIRSGADAAIVLKLVAREPKILSKVNSMGWTLFHLAAQRHLLHVLQALLDVAKELGPALILPDTLNCQDESGLTSIQAAHAVGNREIVDTLKEHGADLHYGGWSELHLASLEDNVADLQTHLGTLDDAQVNPATSRGQTPLLVAAQHGKLHTFEALLYHPGTDTLHTDSAGHNILHFIATSGREDLLQAAKNTLEEEVLEQLCRQSSRAGRTPLTIAAGNSNLDVMRGLLSVLGGLAQSDLQEVTAAALEEAVTKGNSAGVVALLESDTALIPPARLLAAAAAARKKQKELSPGAAPTEAAAAAGCGLHDDAWQMLTGRATAASGKGREEKKKTKFCHLL